MKTKIDKLKKLMDLIYLDSRVTNSPNKMNSSIIPSGIISKNPHPIIAISRYIEVDGETYELTIKSIDT